MRQKVKCSVCHKMASKRVIDPIQCRPPQKKKKTLKNYKISILTEKNNSNNYSFLEDKKSLTPFLKLEILQGSRLTFQLSSQVASERFDFTSQNKFSLATLLCIISYCVQQLKILTRGIQSTMCLQGKFPGAV